MSDAMFFTLLGFTLGGLCGVAIGIAVCMSSVSRVLQAIPSEKGHYRTE